MGRDAVRLMGSQAQVEAKGAVPGPPGPPALPTKDGRWPQGLAVGPRGSASARRAGRQPPAEAGTVRARLRRFKGRVTSAGGSRRIPAPLPKVAARALLPSTPALAPFLESPPQPRCELLPRVTLLGRHFSVRVHGGSAYLPPPPSAVGTPWALSGQAEEGTGAEAQAPRWPDGTVSSAAAGGQAVSRGTDSGTRSARTLVGNSASLAVTLPAPQHVCCWTHRAGDRQGHADLSRREMHTTPAGVYFPEN